MISRDGDGEAPWLSADEPVPLYHLLAVSRATRTSEEELARRLTALHFTPPDLPPSGERRVLRRLVPDSEMPHDPVYYEAGLKPEVTPSAIVGVARAHEMTEQEAADLLRSLGLTLCSLDEPPYPAQDYLDIGLMSVSNRLGFPG